MGGESKSRRILILDASALISGFQPPEGYEAYTTPSILKEVRGGGVSEIRLISSLERGRLQVQAPERRFLSEVEESALQLGESSALSDADKDLLALALQLRPLGWVELVSDDYSIQNMAEALGITFHGLTTRGIRRRFKWLLYCPGCHRVFDRPPIDGLCPYCGSEIRRKPVESHPLRRGMKTP